LESEAITPEIRRPIKKNKKAHKKRGKGRLTHPQ
jgi:hypothetical protein